MHRTLAASQRAASSGLAGTMDRRRNQHQKPRLCPSRQRRSGTARHGRSLYLDTLYGVLVAKYDAHRLDGRATTNSHLKHSGESLKDNTSCDMSSISSDTALSVCLCPGLWMPCGCVLCNTSCINYASFRAYFAPSRARDARISDTFRLLVPRECLCFRLPRPATPFCIPRHACTAELFCHIADLWLHADDARIQKHTFLWLISGYTPIIPAARNTFL